MPENPDPMDIQVGRKLRLQRQMSRLSQSKIAEAIGVTFHQIQKYEKGTNRISASRLQMLASFLAVPVSYFFPGLADTDAAPANPENDGVSVFLTSTDGWKLNRAYLGIKDPAIRAVVLSLVQALAEMKDTSESSNAESTGV
jgi:transcriptional regulator with XRE-family HTH domain